MAVAVTAEVMKGPGMIVGGTMAGDMEIMRIDTEEAIDMVLTITGMTGRDCRHSIIIIIIIIYLPLRITKIKKYNM